MIINKGEISVSLINPYIIIDEDIDEIFLKLDKILFLEERDD